MVVDEDVVDEEVVVVSSSTTAVSSSTTTVSSSTTAVSSSTTAVSSSTTEEICSLELPQAKTNEDKSNNIIFFEINL